MNFLFFCACYWADFVFEATEDGGEVVGEGAEMCSNKFLCFFCEHKFGKCLAVFLA